MRRPIRLSHTLFLPVMVILLSAGAFAEESIPPPPIAQVTIEIRNARGEDESWKSLAESILRIEAGTPYSPDRLTEAIERLKKTEMFSEIDVPDPLSAADGVRITIRLTPFPRVTDIRISGAFPIFEREILNAMTLYTGDAHVPSQIPEQKTAIVQLFKDQGYVSPQVALTSAEDPRDGNYRIQIQVDKGPFWQLRSVTTEGNQAFSSARLLLRTAVWKASLFPGEVSRYVEKELKADVKNLTQFYWSKGYADAVVTPEVTRDPEGHQVDVQFRITEGPLYEIAFSGNDAFWNWQLKKDLAHTRQGNKRDTGIHKSVRSIRDRYRKSGYLKAQIDIRETAPEKPETPVREIHFDITENHRSVVESIAVTGNQSISTEDILDEMLTRPPGVFHQGAYVPAVLKEDLKSIQSRYLKEGFLDTAVEDAVTFRDPEPKEDPNQRLARITLRVQEGPRTLVESIAIQGLAAIPEEKARELLEEKPGEPFRPYMVKGDEEKLSAQISEAGYPHAEVTGTWELSDDRTRARITYRVTEGPFVTMGQIFFKGNFRTAEDILRNELALETGEPFSARRLLEGQRSILAMNALDTAYFKAIGIAERADRVDLIVEVEEKKPYVLQFGGGYDTGRGFFVNILAADQNFLGRNKELSASGEISEIGYRVDLSLKEPRVFGYPVASLTSAYGEKLEEFNQDFGVDTFGVFQSFSKKFLSDRISASLGFLMEYRKQYIRDGKTIPPEDADEYTSRNILVTTPAIVYDTVDNPARPKSGLHAAFSLDISTGLMNSLDNFLKYRIDAKYYWTPLSRLTFAMRGRYGFIDPQSGDSTVPKDQLFFLGGTADVRGFEENMLRFDEQGDSVGGREVILGSIEARIDVGFNFELAAFCDVGGIGQAETESGTDDLRTTAGLGLRYMTPIGPVGLLYGHKLDPREGESDGRLHFSIGYTF